VAGEDIERRLAAILCADVVGYSRLMGEDDAGTLAALKALRKELFAPTVAEHHGRIVKLMGDGALVEFPSVVDAVECAVAVQHGMAERNAGVPKDKCIAFRIGVNLGDIIIEGNDIYGDGVNVAARLQELAAPGGIALSATAHEHAIAKVDVGFADGGEHELKNIAKPVRVYHWSDDANRQADIADTESSLPLPDKPSIAVLSFDNMSGDSEQEYFSDGVAEDIITALSSFRSIFVIARNSSFVYKNTAHDIKKIGIELGVRYVLEGSVRKSASRVRITAQLIDAISGVHLWAERYDRVLEDVFDLQDEITATIVAAIHPELETAERERARVKSASDLDAWDCCQRGMWHGYVFDSENSEKAERCFNNALAIAPQYAPALTGLSWLDFQRVILGYANREPISRDDLIERGLQRASAATRADDRDAFAQYVFGRLLSVKGEFDEAIERLKRAISFNPNYALAYHGLGYAYALGGFPEKAVAQFDTALRLSPRDSYRWAFLTMRAFSLVMCGDYEDAIECGRLARLERPDQFWCYSHTIIALVQLGRLEEAAKAFNDLLVVKPDFSIATIDYTIRFKHAADRKFCIESLRQAGLTG
jgi:adenylate cyclase